MHHRQNQLTRKKNLSIPLHPTVLLLLRFWCQVLVSNYLILWTTIKFMFVHSSTTELAFLIFSFTALHNTTTLKSNTNIHKSGSPQIQKPRKTHTFLHEEQKTHNTNVTPQGLLGEERSSLTPVVIRRQSTDCSVGVAQVTRKANLPTSFSFTTFLTSSMPLEWRSKLKATAWDPLTCLEEQTRHVSGLTRPKNLMASFLFLNVS